MTEEMNISVLNACDHCCTRIEQLSVRLQNHLVLDRVDLHVNCRELLAIVGPNGAGKSTMLKAILGVIPYTGRIVWQIRGQRQNRPRIGYVPQTLDFDREAPVCVADMLACAISRRPVWLGISKSERRHIAQCLEAVSAAHLHRNRIGDLSGGELQRVLLCLALTANPDILLLDEPVAGIDKAGVDLFLAIVKDLLASLDIAVLMVTHDLLGVAPHANRMLLLNRSVIAEGTPAEVLASQQMAEAFARPQPDIKPAPWGEN